MTTTLTQFPDLAIEAYTHEGGIYGVPDNVASIALFYNQDMFEEAGAMLPTAQWDDEGWTVDDFFSSCEKLTKVDANGRTTQYACDVTGWDKVWQIWVRIFGGQVVDDPFFPTECTLNEAGAVEGLQFYADLRWERGFAPMQLSDDKEYWTNLRDHELYNMGHLLTAASVHHRITGKRNFLQIAINLGDHLSDLFLPRSPELAHFGFNPSNTMGAIDLYRATGSEKYLELAKTFVDMRGSQPGGRDLDQSFMALREETRAVGHAVTAGYLYCGATDVYAETGDEELLAGLHRIWDNAVNSKMYITGGTSAQHSGSSQRPEFGGRSGPVHEAFGYEYQLPNATAYNETCANIAHAMWNWRLLNLSGDAKYADVMERVLYNSMLSSMSLDGITFCYTNPLRWYGAEHPLLSPDVYQR